MLAVSLWISLPAHSQTSGQLSRVYWIDSCNSLRDDLIRRRANGDVDLDANGNFAWYELMAYQHCGRVRKLLMAAEEAGIYDKIEFWQGTEVVSDLIVEALPPGKQVDLPLLRIVFPENVFFDTNSFETRAEVWPVLSVIADSMISEPQHIALFVAGHSDFRGPRAFNEALSRRRARAGLAAIKVLGVSRGETYTVAFGEDLPINPSLNLEDIGVNRRLEFLVAPVAEVAIEYILRQQPSLPCIGNEDREIGYCPDLERPVRADIAIEQVNVGTANENTVVNDGGGGKKKVDTGNADRVVVRDKSGERVVVMLPVEERVVVVYGADG